MKKRVIACCDNMDMIKTDQCIRLGLHLKNIFKCKNCKNFYIRSYRNGFEILNRVKFNYLTRKWVVVKHETKGNIYENN